MNRARILMLIVAGVFLLAGPLTAGETTVGGEIYANWNLHLNDHGQGKNYNVFEVNQAYIDIMHKFDDKFSARVTADIFNDDDFFNGWEFRAQYAYLQINKLLPYTDMRFGLQQVVWDDKFEQAWGLRFIDRGSLEKLGYSNYADLGASFYGVCPGGWGELVLQIMNGGGYTESEVNKYKDITLFASVTPLLDYPAFKESAIWFQYQKGFPNIEPVIGLSFSDNTKKDRISGAGLIKYRQWFTAYGEYFMATDDINPTETPIQTVTEVDLPEEDKATGVALFAKINVATSETFLSDVYIFGKYEYVDKHQDHDAVGLELFADEDDAKHIVIGAGYELLDGFDFALTFKRSTVNRIEEDNEGMPLRVAETEKNSLMINMRAAF